MLHPAHFYIEPTSLYHKLKKLQSIFANLFFFITAATLSFSSRVKNHLQKKFFPFHPLS